MRASFERLAWFGTPVVITLILHALLFAALAVKFSEPKTAVARVAKPVAIQAALVSADDLKRNKQAAKKPEPKPKPKPKPEPKPKPTPKPTPKVEQKSLPKAELQETPAPKVALEPDPKVQEAALAQQALKDLDAALATDRPAQEGVQGSPSDTAAAIIQRAVINRWTRPPSARNGMRAALEIALVPTGDVVGVTVLESSGNVAFDRSAINAVEKAARFPEVQQLDRAIFERDFRRFQLIFRPEDLRY